MQYNLEHIHRSSCKYVTSGRSSDAAEDKHSLSPRFFSRQTRRRRQSYRSSCNNKRSVFLPTHPPPRPSTLDQSVRCSFPFSVTHQSVVITQFVPLVSMAKKRNRETTKSVKEINAPPPPPQESLTRDGTSCSYEGERLDVLLGTLQRSVELAKASRGQTPEKIWTKLQFAIGVNDVTRVLERMPLPDSNANLKEDKATKFPCKPHVTLQAVLISTDCNPKWLTKHIPVIAASRNVPVLALKDNKGSSLRLGELVNVRTALAIGIKARNSTINKTIEEVLSSSKTVDVSLSQ